MRDLRVSHFSVLGGAFAMAGIVERQGTDDVIRDQLESGTFDEYESLAIWLFLAKVSRPGSLLVDVGAFTGVYALAACAASRNVKAVAFEPSAVTFGRLAMNVKLSALDLRVIPANLALSDERGPVSFPHRYGIYNLCPGESLGQSTTDHTQTAFRVLGDDLLSETEDLPDYLNSTGIPLRPFRNVRAVKIDVERHEPCVLAGMSDVIRRDRPAVICESLGSVEERSLEAAFSEFNYSKLSIERERNILFLPAEVAGSFASAYGAWRALNPGPLCRLAVE